MFSNSFFYRVIKSRDCGKGLIKNMFLMSLCNNFDQLFVHISRPKKGIQHCTDLDLSTSKKNNANPFPIHCFHDPEVNYTKKKVGKEEIDCNNEFSFLHNVFLPCRSRSTIFLLTLPTLKFLQPLLIWTSLKFCRLRKV